MASVTGVPANMPGVEKKLLGPRRTGEGVDIPCAFRGRRGDGISRRGVPITGASELHAAHKTSGPGMTMLMSRAFQPQQSPELAAAGALAFTW